MKISVFLLLGALGLSTAHYTGEPHTGPVCGTQPKNGNCEDRFPYFVRMYYYNVEIGRCMRFKYWGCGQLKDFYNNKRQCECGCASVVCRLKPDPGACPTTPGPTPSITTTTSSNTTSFDATSSNTTSSDTSSPNTSPTPQGSTATYITRYYFNEEKGKCQMFKFYACGGNSNRFHTKAACQKLCVNNCL